MLNELTYNPDVLDCLANLSSDEVFTPPKLVNDMLDLLPEALWSDPQVAFLDPATKSGVFLREIAKRLMVGLEDEIPDRQQRIDHIFGKQLYGLAITELTAFLSRRSLYCSKKANGPYSICTTFANGQGNIHFERVEHYWQRGRCMYCGASRSEYERGVELETHAYAFIHPDDAKDPFKMKFDVIIGNPPYQLNDGGGTGTSARPIYNLFVHQAKLLNPRYLTMIIPSRWFSGGKGLDGFRSEMLSDSRIRRLIDYSDSNECFPGVDIAGGICYFLWDRDNRGDCDTIFIHNGKETKSLRNLNEFDVFIRDSIAAGIVRKVRTFDEDSLELIVSARRPFGLDSKVRPQKAGDLNLVWSGGSGPYPSSKITSGQELIAKWKVLLSKASYDHGGQPDKDGKRRIFSRVEVLEPGEVCSETYLVVGPFETRDEATCAVAYLKTKFCRFLVSTILLTQNISRGKFAYVPIVDFEEVWSDEQLYAKYGLTENEIALIESMIRSMELEDA